MQKTASTKGALTAGISVLAILEETFETRLSEGILLKMTYDAGT
jgi:NCAIR mutase (PurE)-related protein